MAAPRVSEVAGGPVPGIAVAGLADGGSFAFPARAPPFQVPGTGHLARTPLFFQPVCSLYSSIPGARVGMQEEAAAREGVEPRLLGCPERFSSGPSVGARSWSRGRDAQLENIIHKS